MKYLVHFINHNSEYRNAIEYASSKDEAIKQASYRDHFNEAFLVMAKHHSTPSHARTAMIKKYGHHAGIA